MSSQKETVSSARIISEVNNELGIHLKVVGSYNGQILYRDADTCREVMMDKFKYAVKEAVIKKAAVIHSINLQEICAKKRE